MGKTGLEIAAADRQGLYYVGRMDESGFAVPYPFARHARGYERVTLMDRALGSVHMGVGVCRLEPRGEVDTCVLAYEKGIYLMEGEVEMKRGGVAFRLSADDFALIPCGTSHAFRNTGATAARWFEMQAPQPKPPGGWQDTFFVAAEIDWPAQAMAPDFSSPQTQWVGHFEAEAPLARTAGGASGLAVYRFMEKKFGAQNFFMMRGELAKGGVRSRHDHTVEEVYFALSGETDMEIENERFHLRAGDVAWTGVGASHAFAQTGPGPFRWIETQAPQFPAQNGTRNYRDWEKLA